MKLCQVVFQIDCPDSWTTEEVQTALDQLGNIGEARINMYHGTILQAFEEVLGRELPLDLGYKPEQNLLSQLTVRIV